MEDRKCERNWTLSYLAARDVTDLCRHGYCTVRVTVPLAVVVPEVPVTVTV